MKKWMIFVSGVVTGMILTIAVAFIIGLNRAASQPQEDAETEVKGEDDGIHYFEEPGEIINEKSVQVFQVLAKDAALVRGKSPYTDSHLGTIYLLVNDEEKYYYDDEIIKVPENRIVRQVGIYRYPTKNEIIKTVPIIEILYK